MNSQEKLGYINEVKYQKNMLNHLNKWLRNTIICSSICLLFIYFFSNNLILGIIGYVLTLLCVVCILAIGLAIYRGRKNINNIIDVIENKIS